MHHTSLLASLSFLAAASRAQQVGTQTAETHPKLTTQKCTTAGGCADQSTSIVLDANWRWLHTTEGYTNCYTGQEWDTSICSDPTTCATSCALDGADYEGTYGITTSGNALTMSFVTQGSQKNVGGRVYLLAPDSDDTYEQFKLKNQEFTFDVDVSKLACGLNGALYFSEMDADGGLSKYENNKAGAKYGTGYCDTQCPHDIKFINGEANILNWTKSETDVNAGSGHLEMDIWEANSQATALTPHVCTADIIGQVRCNGTECGDGDNRYGGVCDKDGCDYNPYRMGNESFYGSNGSIIDTTTKFTVITQFITSDNTSTGDLVEIRRKYVQDGKVIENSFADYDTLSQFNSISDDFCDAQKTLFGDTNDFKTKGGIARMGESFERGMTLVMSIWDDHAANALWLDSTYPVDADATKPGIKRGPCGTDTGVPDEVESEYADATVTYSNIRYGDIDSTYSA
ncbi:putative glycoside hydrolase family 7 protein [Neofusicoccum parvum UCRNP2]|uniref:Glucanase n=2 Tax=Neofusicoccum parvum TaxID=310453 RepID=R1EEG3_BOTPV|nr:putative glycoside hydrolase family 7 protein [Neofusicoccum parvum UCRNP2]GME53471.1 putative glycoside hydrolase family 7 protein [Neofusicoccum parvum]